MKDSRVHSILPVSRLPVTFLIGVSLLILLSCGVSSKKSENQKALSSDGMVITPDDIELTPEQRTALLLLSRESRTPLRVEFDPATRSPVWIGLQLPVVDSDPKVNVQAFLSEFGELFQVNKLGLLVNNADIVETKCCYKIGLSQSVYDIPVYAAGMEFVQHKNGWISNIRAMLIPEVTVPVGTIPVAKAKDTLKKFLDSRLPKEAFELIKVEKVILSSHLSPGRHSRSYITWRFNLPAHDSKYSRDWFIDASSGEYLAEFISAPLHTQYPESSAGDVDWPLTTHNTDYTSGSFYHPVWSETGTSAARNPCSDAKLMEVKAKATEDGAKTVAIDCDLVLESNDTITKRLVLEGKDATGVTVDCNVVKRPHPVRAANR
jgi:hypothetical protein